MSQFFYSFLINCQGILNMFLQGDLIIKKILIANNLIIEKYLNMEISLFKFLINIQPLSDCINTFFFKLHFHYFPF